MHDEKASKKQVSMLRRFLRVLTAPRGGVGKEREHLLENISMLTAGGMSIFGAVDAVRQGTRAPGLQRVLAAIADGLESGYPFWRTLAATKLFRGHTISLVRVGEESGKLSDNLKLVAEQEAKEREFRSKMRGAMMYPVFVLTVTVVVGTLIAWFILPRLATVFEQLDVELPTLTKLLIAGGTFLGTYGHIAIPGFIVVVALMMYAVFYAPKTKFIGQYMLFALPGIHGLIQEIELARFGYLLGTLLQAGVPITNALESLEQATLFPQYRNLYAFLRERIAEGNSFRKSFIAAPSAARLIPSHVQQLLVAGEQSGNLAATLLSMSASYEAKTEQTTKNISVILEPIMLVIVWLGVVAVALAVILPIYSLIGGLNTDPAEQVRQPASDVVAAPFEAPLDEYASSTIDAGVATTTPAETPATTTASQHVATTSAWVRIRASELGYVNVRSAPATESEILGQALPDDVYPLVDEREGWYQIVFGDSGLYGWVIGTYANIEKP